MILRIKNPINRQDGSPPPLRKAIFSSLIQKSEDSRQNGVQSEENSFKINSSDQTWSGEEGTSIFHENQPPERAPGTFV
jgi:uncharacterized protein YllA (UPF0747 family)